MLRRRLVPTPRRGVILLVVMTLLMLFAVVGLSFVLYANAAARSAQLHREAGSAFRPDVDPEQLFAYFLGQLIYDVPDDESGVYSALRGHSLARNMYGHNGGPPSLPSAAPTANLVPFNGAGRLRAPSPFGTHIPGSAVLDDQLMNYTFYPEDPQLPPAQRFLRDPERLGWRPANLKAPRGPYAGGCNTPYTYPDLNSTFLAAVRADGTVLLPSFYRPWAAAAPDSGLSPQAGEFYDRLTGQLNPLWSATPGNLPPWFKYTTLRPLPVLNPGFPPPEDGGGDVKNLIGSPGTLRFQNGSVTAYWNNDSFWMDLGYPVLRTATGRKYKPLFAALITDLDNRVNVNVHGNLLGRGQTHASNQGWGPWEVNLGRVLARGDGLEWRHLLRGAVAPPMPGRYGGRPWEGQVGTPGTPHESMPSGLAPHFYSQVDFDGCNEQARQPSGRLLLPGLGAPPLSSFPSFLTPTGDYAGYGNRSPAERRDHARLYDVFQPRGDDRRFALSNMEALLRYGDTGSSALTSELFRLCPANFADPRIRRLVTTHSVDLDRPGAPPWVHDPASYPYDLPPTTDPDQPALPQGPSIPFPSPPAQNLTLSHALFTGLDWRARNLSVARIDLNRPLPPYPHQGSGQTPPYGPPLTRDANGQVALDVSFAVDAPHGPIWKQFVLAQAARQRLAEEIYRQLLVVTGVPPLLPDQNPQAPPPDLLRVRRWLAQLAVNIVDCRDEDDISTPLLFYTAADYQHLPSPPSLPPDPGRVDPARRTDGPFGEIQWPLYWVFGTELPRLVVNEAMAQIQIHDPDQAYTDLVRVFVELHHPFPRALPAGVHPPDSFPVPLRMATGTEAYSPYRVVIGVKAPLGERPTGAAILPGPANDNVLGNPDLAAVRCATRDADFLSPVPTVGTGPQAPWPGAFGPLPYRGFASPFVPAHGPDAEDWPQGFLLLGPPEAAPDPFPTFDPFVAPHHALIPKATPVLRTANLQYVRKFLIRQPQDPPDERMEGVTVVLRRLANPYLPFDGRRRLATETTGNLTYNPYVTVDYLEDIPVQPVTLGGHLAIVSRGKRQPYAAHRSLLAAQTLGPSLPVRTSFGRENVPAPARYDWLTHLDRPLISPLELLHVSGYQPYQLTQRFLSLDKEGQVRKFGQRAPWLDDGRAPGAPSARLYRLLEFLETGSRAAGVAAGGRRAGKINLNTVWDPETLRALWDAQASNSFPKIEADRIFEQFLYDQRPTSMPNPLRRTQGLIPSAEDRPFWGLAPGVYPSGDQQFPTGGGIEDTFLRLQSPATEIHPYLDHEGLTKVFNHLTTRSNLFAVWLTVGFFEVTDDTTRPVMLGAEVGRAENRQVRHRLFAVVDRTNLSIASCLASLAGPIVPPPPPDHLDAGPRTVAVSALHGFTTLPLTGPRISWRIQAGTTLVVDTGANQEVVQVLAVNALGTPPTLTAVFTKPHALGTPLALAHLPGAPPVFLKPITVLGPEPLPGPPYVPQPPYPITVRVAVNPRRSNATTLAGEYDGIPWTIQAGTKLLLDVGPQQEVVTVLHEPFAIDPVTATGSFRVLITRQHAEGFLIANTLLGNPGPQLRFQPRDPVFGAVVRYLSVIE
ncbi:MAG: hypothetical protein L0Z62_33295 [Gemmataceae bacterium]|nr:hypothetical protein [Gemmataceae bacterium]